MKNILSVILIAFCFWSCEDIGKSGNTGSIYGVVTLASTAEPMRVTSVELYFHEALLLKTITYDDGDYQFTDLDAGNYQLRVVATGYDDARFDVIVEAGRTAQADMQLTEVNTDMAVRTLDITNISGDKPTLNGTCAYVPTEVGFVYATHSNPSDGGTRIKAEVQKKFSATISDLAKRVYFICSYAKNSIGTSYGETVSFSTEYSLLLSV